jgi:hypothetical protein
MGAIRFCVSSLLLLMAACTGDPAATSSGPAPTTTGTGGGGGEGGGSGGAGATGATAEELFEAVEPKILEECGACHKLEGAADAPFLAQPDVYASITSWPGIVVPLPSESVLLTHPGDPAHGAGQAPDLSAELRDLATAWLEKEAEELPVAEDEGKPHLLPFKPLVNGAFNTVYFDPLGPQLVSSSMSFHAELLGDPPSILRLYQIEVHPIADLEIHVVHPLMTVYTEDAPPDPDPVDSFSTLDQSFSLETSPVLGTGELLLTNWVDGAYLGIAFDKIEVLGGGAVPSDCKDVALFEQAVVPKLSYCADNCHGGKKPEAMAAMDLSQLGVSPPAAACAQVRARINPTEPAASQIFVVTDPKQQVVHMYKFMGSANAHAAFVAAATPWIEAEQ